MIVAAGRGARKSRTAELEAHCRARGMSETAIRRAFGRRPPARKKRKEMPEEPAQRKRAKARSTSPRMNGAA